MQVQERNKRLDWREEATTVDGAERSGPMEIEVHASGGREESRGATTALEQTPQGPVKSP